MKGESRSSVKRRGRDSLLEHDLYSGCGCRTQRVFPTSPGGVICHASIGVGHSVQLVCTAADTLSAEASEGLNLLWLVICGRW